MATKKRVIDTPAGKREVDSSDAAVGVVRLDVNQSYPGAGALLADYINHASQRAWKALTAKIDYTYRCLDLALAPLDEETAFSREILKRLDKGQKLFFKPNLVGVMCVDPETHQPMPGYTTCTAWPFIAALMRWFHDSMGVNYHQMAIGEAATGMAAAAATCTMLHPKGRKITTEAVIEGRVDDFYGGWGFYFARKYLAESHPAGHTDDPMRGYEESVAGQYIPPGLAGDRLMVYDLNRLNDDPNKGRTVRVPDGVNFQSITLHKAIVGGDPKQPRDMIAYPGCVLINVPKLKVHIYTIITNVIKNLGIGLYPMQYASAGGHQWDYAVPHAPIPGIKGGIPHQVWVPEMDAATGLPEKDGNGGYRLTRTGGINATMVDIIKAVAGQNVFMLHVVDGVEATNQDHQGSLPGVLVPEGMVFAGLDPVATDLMSARYLFNNVPLAEAEKAGLKSDGGGFFCQRVPIPAIQNGQIITATGYDCPLARDRSFQYAEKRGLGKRKYHAIGTDAVTNLPIVSVQGHPGTAKDETFTDLITSTLYYDVYKLPWDLQKTSFSYFDCVDKLTGTTLKQEFLDAFDEDGDGVVTYDDGGKKGMTGFMLHWGGTGISVQASEPFGYLRGRFLTSAALQKYSEPSWNKQGHGIMKEYYYGAAVMVAMRLSQMEMEMPDPFVAGLTWGKGKWPSYFLVSHLMKGQSLYGATFPTGIGIPSLYGDAFQYADRARNGGHYTGISRNQPAPDALQRYFLDVENGRHPPLQFTLFVPPGFGNVAGKEVPNVTETMEPEKILTVTFGDGEKW